MAIGATKGANSGFDDTVYKDVTYSTKDGELNPTTYQGALGLRKFMHDKNLPFITEKQVTEGVNTGQVTLDDGKMITLNAEEKAAFTKVSREGLFNRLDGGSNNTQDGIVGIQDINDAIKQSWKLHGNEISKNGHWSVPHSKSDTTFDEAKKVVLDHMDKHNLPHLTVDDMRQYLQTHRFATKDGMIDADPKLLEAIFFMAADPFGTDPNGDNHITVEEVKNWKTTV